MATSSRHSLPTQPKSREEKRAWLYNDQFQNRRHKQLTKVRTRGVTALERSMEKQFSTGGLNQVLGRTNLTLAAIGSHMKQTSTSCLGEISPSIRQFCMQKHTNMLGLAMLNIGFVHTQKLLILIYLHKDI